MLKYKLLDKEAKYLAWLTLISSIVSIVAIYKVRAFVSEADRVNVHYFNFFAIAQYVIFNRLYFCLLRSKLWKKLLNVFLLLVLVFTVLNWLSFQPIMTRLSTNIICIGNVSYVLFSLLHFSQLLNSEKYHNLMHDWTFWLSAGLLLYNSSTFVLFLMTNYLADYNMDVYTASSRLNAIFNIVLTGFYFTSLFIATKRYKLI